MLRPEQWDMRRLVSPTMAVNTSCEHPDLACLLTAVL